MRAQQRPGSRTSKAQDVLPLVYFAAALLLTVLCLPTVLRPPQQPPTQTAELSPDAPPDDEQESVISSFSRGVTGTAGTGDGVGEGDSVAGTGIGPGGPAPRARGCPFGYGNPPRQTFSYFSAPCAPSFIGNNGGATSKGVTATEVRVAISDPNGDHGTEGPVPDTPRQDESTADRTYRVWQKFFNTHYQFYGRRLQLYIINGNDTSDNTKQRAAAIKADEIYNVFAGDMGRWATMDELARRKIIAFSEQGDYFSGSWFADHRPYMWSTRGDGTHLMRLSAEYFCKSLNGKPARFAGDPTIATQTRKIGFLYNDNDGYRRTEPEFRRFVKEGCGADVAISIGYPGNGAASFDVNTTSSAASRLRAAGVTTVVSSMNLADQAATTGAATASGYFPEWIVTGMGLVDVNFDASLQDTQQWDSAFGIGSAQISDGQGLPGADMSYEIGYRAYKQIDPVNNPDNVMTIRLFPQLEQIANGIQMAGPNLTPETFEKGLFALGQLVHEVPKWEVIGGFKPGDYSYADKVGLIWWDPQATSDNTGYAGAYRWMEGGRRFGVGELPTGEHPELFNTGVSRRAEANW